MKLSKSLSLLALASALVFGAVNAEATVTFKSSVSCKFTATVQDLVNDETSDGSVSTAFKVTIVNKDILEAFEEWWSEGDDLPDGAALAFDLDYGIVIVDRAGDILYTANDLVGFLEIYYGDSITSNGRYREKDNGDWIEKYTETYLTEFIFMGVNLGQGRSAEIDTDTDWADLEGIDIYEYSDSYDASKTTYKSTSTDKINLSGQAIIEDSDAVVSGELKGKYNYKDDDYSNAP